MTSVALPPTSLWWSSPHISKTPKNPFPCSAEQSGLLQLLISQMCLKVKNEGTARVFFFFLNQYDDTNPVSLHLFFCFSCHLLLLCVIHVVIIAFWPRTTWLLIITCRMCSHILHITLQHDGHLHTDKVRDTVSSWASQEDFLFFFSWSECTRLWSTTPTTVHLSYLLLVFPLYLSYTSWTALLGLWAL